MWGGITKAGVALIVLGPLMWLLRTILNPLVTVATSGPNANAQSVQTIANWFAILSLPNLTLISGIGIVVYVFGRSVAESGGGV